LRKAIEELVRGQGQLPSKWLGYLPLGSTTSKGLQMHWWDQLLRHTPGQMKQKSVDAWFWPAAEQKCLPLPIKRNSARLQSVRKEQFKGASRNCWKWHGQQEML